MNYCGIKKTDIANGLGVRVSLFVSGCRKHCPGCFQPETWDFDYGKSFTKQTEDEILEALRPTWIQGLSILGGEPMEPENQEALLPFLKRVHRELPDKDIWLYTGYLLEDISESPLLPYVDVLVDGPFVEAKKDAGLSFRGSRNQRVIDLKGDGPIPTPNDNIRCKACGCVFPMKIEFRMDGEISIIFFRCPSCGKGYPISVTDEALRNSMRKYSQLLGKKKQVLGRMQKRLQKLKASNAKRCEELEKLYFPEGERMESDGRIQ